MHGIIAHLHAGQLGVDGSLQNLEAKQPTKLIAFSAKNLLLTKHKTCVF